MRYDKDLVIHKLIRWENYLNNYKLPEWKELPDIGLYMDQVIALLGQYLDFIPVEEQRDKPVTSTTINNYVRLKVMPPPEKRKYYRIHIAYLIMIFTLKQGTSISSLQKILPMGEEEETVRTFYNNYVHRVQQVGHFYTTQTRAAGQDLLSAEAGEETVEDFIIQTILMSGFSQILGEKLLHLRDADTQEMIDQEALTDSRGVHPIAVAPRRGKGE